MKLINALNACNVIAPSKDVRYYLNGVAVHVCNETGKLAALSATDCHQLVLITVNQSVDLSKCKATVLSKNDIKLINLKYPKMDCAGFDGPTSQDIQDIFAACEKIDGNYPDITRVIPAKNRTAKLENIGLNVDYLANISKIHTALMKGQKDKQYPAWAFNFASASESMTARTHDGNGLECLYVLMPARI